MKIFQSKLFSQAAVWLCAEIVLNCTGLDNLADYSEFIWQNRFFLSATLTLPSLVI